MKFLCDNCKAKYQIADEKISGRTLRMNCRKCGHDIVLRGEEHARSEHSSAARRPGSIRPPKQPPAPPPAKRPPTRGSSSGLAPAAASRASARPSGSALGADFRRQVTSNSAHDIPAPRATALDQWHVAINDVPVGPIKRDELARKIATGAVNGDSLCWREGFDDWRPVKDVPELAGLLRHRRSVPAPPRPGAPVGRGIGSTRQSPSARPAARPPSSPAFPRVHGEVARPAARSNVVPIGGRLGAAAAPAIDDSNIADFADPFAEATRISEGPPPMMDDAMIDADIRSDLAGATTMHSPFPPPAAPTPYAAEAYAPAGASTTSSMAPPAAKRQIPFGVMIAMVGAGAFAIALAAIIAVRLVPGASDDADATAANTQNTESQAAQPNLVLDIDEANHHEGASGETTEATEGARNPAKSGTKRVAAKTTETTPDKNNSLTPEQRALLAKMAGGGAAPGNLRGGNDDDVATSGSGEGLSAQQLRTVVNRNRPALQRCYELSTRGMDEAPTVRMDVDITVGMSGTVTTVRARGNGVGTFSDCLENTVRRWRFPTAGNTTQMSFPVVFSAAG